MATSAADVPGRFDLVISGGSLANPVGFVFLDALEPSLPFRTHRAIYSYTPTFIERSNVSGNFGDNQQDFFLTSSQRDWSDGEQQRFFRASDQDSVRRYWRGTAVDVSTPGKVAMRQQIESLTAAAQPVAIGAGAQGATLDLVFFASSTNLYEVSPTGVTDRGAHGLGAAPSKRGLATDQAKAYLSTTAAGTVGVRAWSYGAASYSTFSASGADVLAVLNNTLYGMRLSSTTGDLVRYDTAGTLTSIFPWKNADGSVPLLGGAVLRPFGGKLAILLEIARSPWELWIYDGSGTSKIAALPPHFYAEEMIVSLGTIFISGVLQRRGATRAAVYYYANGTLGQLWQADDWNSGGGSTPSLVAFTDGLVWHDTVTGNLLFYNPATGGVSALATAGVGATYQGEAGSSFFVFISTTTNYRKYPSGSSTAAATTSTVTTSLFDFDSSLTKSIRAATVEFDLATDGDGGSVDVAYRVGDVDGSYTTLATGITSGAENLISGVSGKSISIKVTLNKGTSTNGPVLKRISVRAAPILTSFRMGEYVIDCTGDGGKSPRTLRDGTPNPLSGSEAMAQLEIAKASTSPLTITDRRGTYTGFIETLEGYEEHPGIDDPTRSGEFVTKMITRGV